MLSPAPHIDVHALMRGLVHELRNPLSAILTASSLLKGDQGIDDESAMLLEVVEKESRRMNRILTEFSSFVKPPVPHPEVFDVAQMLRDLARETQKDATSGHAIEVRDDLPAQLAVYGDPQQCQQAFQHLFTNAAETMPDGGALRLHASVDDQSAHIFLDDSGGGLPDEVLERVLQPFFSTKPTSTGLGLSIASSLLRASGGEVSVHNQFSEVSDVSINGQEPLGAQVRVCLPRGA